MADASENLNSAIARLAAESERIKSSSAEFLWICKGATPPKIPDLPQPQGETNPLRRPGKGLSAEARSAQTRSAHDYASQYRRADGTIGDLREIDHGSR
jgi:hypothetical protein